MWLSRFLGGHDPTWHLWTPNLDSCIAKLYCYIGRFTSQFLCHWGCHTFPCPFLSRWKVTLDPASPSVRPFSHYKGWAISVGKALTPAVPRQQFPGRRSPSLRLPQTTTSPSAVKAANAPRVEETCWIFTNCSRTCGHEGLLHANGLCSRNWMHRLPFIFSIKINIIRICRLGNHHLKLPY